MYKILVVEDEDIIRKGIIQAISWNELNISQVFEARNGEEALSIYEQHQPDIILSDIRMPRLSGIELLSLVKEMNDKVVFILLSGYEEFEFAQTAIREGAFGYLLKSSGRDEVVHTLKEAIKQLDHRYNKEKVDATFRQEFHKNLPVLRQQLLNELLYGSLKEEEQYSRLSFCGVYFNFKKYYLSMGEIDHNFLNPNLYTAEDLLLYRFCIDNIIEETFRDKSIVFQSHEGRFIVLSEIIHESEVEMKKVIEKWDLIMQLTQCYYQLTLSVAITDGYEGLSQVKEAFGEAKKTISYKLYSGENSIILSRDIKQDLKDAYEISEVDMAHLKTELHVGNQGRVVCIIEDIFEKVISKKIDIYGFRLVCLDLVSLAKKVAYKLDKDAITELLSDVDLLNEMGKIETSEYGRQWVLTYYQRVLHHINSGRMNKTKAIIQQATNYIELNYTQDITLNDVAKTIHLSASYFSGLFSQETGMSFLAFLTQLRINRSKELLSQDKLNVSEVGLQVGYPNPYYFSRIFKKHIGVSPMEYKDSMNKAKG